MNRTNAENHCNRIIDVDGYTDPLRSLQPLGFLSKLNQHINLGRSGPDFFIHYITNRAQRSDAKLKNLTRQEDVILSA